MGEDTLDAWYIIVADDDGHWYVIDEDEREIFNDWVESSDDSPYHFDDCRLPGAPSWVKFREYEIR